MIANALNATDLSYHLGELPDRDSYLKAAAACLRTTVGGDLVGWNNNLDVATHSAEVWFDPLDANVSNETLIAVFSNEAVITMLDEHPVLRRYLAHPDHTAPLRISDCMSDRQWRSSGVYSKVFVPMGVRHQLCIAVRTPTIVSSRGWAINRSTSDFTDADVARARALQPVLDLLDRIYHPGNAPKTEDARRDEARQRAGLTSREGDVIMLIADGLSAQQIARLRRISVRTVRKHLENIYAKLECHDRLLAVNSARHLGLL
jgi:DNA-binding CsgD family transcriptional regulator